MSENKQQRWRLMVSVMSGNILVVIAAQHRTKATLREAYKVAQAFVNEDRLEMAEARDEQKKEVLASCKKKN